MKVNYKGLLDMEFISEEASLATQFFKSVLESDKEVVAVPQPVINAPISTTEFLKQQEEHRRIMAEKERSISDLTNRLNQATTNYNNIKKQLEDTKINTKKEWERQDELDEAYVTIKNKTAEIINLQRKVEELKNQPNMYTSGMADALKSEGLISDEEHQKALNNITMGKGVNTYWDDFSTYVDNYVPCPILVTDFGKYSVVNCTPHPVTLSGKNGVITIGPSEVCTRLEMDQKEVELPGSDLPLVVESKGKLINVPMRQPRTLYVVSRIVFDVSVDREDFICPNTIKATKSNGQVVSVPTFICRKELIMKAEEEMELNGQK